MPIFKGFEKQDETLLAVVSYPNAKVYKRDFTENGASQIRQEPFPHELRLDEDAFNKRFQGRLGFDTLKTLPYREEGHDLKPLLAEQAQQLEDNVPNPGQRHKPGGDNTM